MVELVSLACDELDDAIGVGDGSTHEQHNEGSNNVHEHADE